MIEGVTILNQVEHGTPGLPVIIIFLAIIIIFCLVSLFYLIREFVFDLEDILAITLVIGVMAIGVWLLYTNVTARETIVQATIDDTASFVKVNEVYKFIRQEGQIYILQLRTP